MNKGAPIPIAVLPLVNLSPDPANGYLADGLTSEIINELSIIEGLSVRSQTSSFALKGKPRNVQEAGGQLQADYIVEGSVLRDSQHLRINARLVRTRDDVPIWSRMFEREWTDVLSVQDEIARGIVNSLRLKLGGGRRRYETSTEAYDLYLRARASGAQRFPGDNEVIGLLAEAHSALGAAYARNGQWTQAEASLRRAIQIDPNLSMAHDNLTWFYLFPLGRIEEAIREARAEVRLDPLSPMARYLLAETLISAHRYDEAASQCEKLPADFVFTGDCLGRALLGQGRTAEAIRVLATANSWGYLAYAYGRTGRRDEVERLSAAAPLAYPNRHGHFQYALVYAGLKDKDRTIDQLESWAGVGPVRMGFTLTAPEFAFVRADPRVEALRKKVGLPQ